MTEVEKQLRDYNWIKRNIEEARQQIEIIDDTIEALRELSAVEYSDMPKAKVIASVVESKAERIELELINLQSWNNRLEKYYKQEQEILDWLDYLQDNQREIVTLRAIKKMKWYMISRVANYNQDHARRLYHQAINSLQRYQKKMP